LVIENLSLAIGRLHHFGNAGGKLPQSIRESLGRHADAVYMTDDKFSMTDFQSSQSLKPFPGHRSAKKAICTAAAREGGCARG
jgi:hypothetical protein